MWSRLRLAKDAFHIVGKLSILETVEKNKKKTHASEQKVFLTLRMPIT